MAQQAMQNGILPGEFYNSSFSDMMSAQNARSRKERPQDPLTLVGSDAFTF
ncbi:hypothetical protein [Limosilactobacillus reuteri]|uniref:hypothetical protein n=1 Tax=Limosilactobacillus reuteri TaxID=1598 RepID=UPI002B058363|nr:hypothetical protein [Limosilactobacillus reuteri]